MTSSAAASADIWDTAFHSALQAFITQLGGPSSQAFKTGGPQAIDDIHRMTQIAQQIAAYHKGWDAQTRADALLQYKLTLKADMMLTHSIDEARAEVAAAAAWDIIEKALTTALAGIK